MSKVFFTKEISGDSLVKACIDLVYNSNDSGRDYLIERI